MDVSGGISVDRTWILTGGSQTVGGSSTTSTATNTNIFGGEQDVVSNGLASYTTIYQGVQRVTGEYVHEGPTPGKADHTAIDGGEQDVDTGIATATRVNSGGIQNVTNGGSASGTIVESGGVLKVSGETVETAPVYPEPVIRSVATGATINYQGEFDVTGGGTAVDAIVHGGVMTVSGSIPDPFAGVPGQPAVDASMAIGTTIENGGTLAVSNGALASGTTLQNFATLNVDAGGTATDTTIDLGTMQLSAGATATNTVVNLGGAFIVLGNASFSGTVFNAGSTFEIGGGTIENGFAVANGVTLTVLDGGILKNSIVTTGGTLILEAGATFSNATFQSGATFVVDYDYAVDGFTVASGVTYKVIGAATNTTISAGGKQIVGNFGEGGSATNTVINGGEQDVELLATASYTTISMGGIQHVAGLYIHDEPGPGRADHTTINTGGEQDVDTGIVSSTTVNAGGVQNLTNGGIASDTIVASGGIVNASGETVYYSPGGYYATVIRSEFDSADVGSGGQLHLTGAGIAKNATIDGGAMTVSGSIPDPVTNDPSLPPDPSAPAVDASEATGTILNSGSVSVSDGGIVTSTTLNSGTLDVLDQGTANASTIHHGATELVEAGGIVGATTIAGGTLDLKAGAIADDVITFSGQGTLRIEQKLVSGPSTFASAIKGIALGDQIDLSGLSYTNGATATVSGSTLTVSNGTASETFILADTSVTHFGITKDGADGILLTADTHPTGPTTINGPASGYAIIEGTTGNDIIHAYGMFNIIHGNGGDDAIYAGLYAAVDVPSGDSSVYLAGFDNRVTGGDGNVTVKGATGATTIALGNGNDSIDASGYGNIITLGNGKDIVHPGDGASTTTSGNGDDQVTLSGFGNKVVLGNGNDVVTSGGGANNITLGDGDNTVDLDGMANQISVGSGTNTIIAGNGVDSIVAGAGHDTITLGGVANHVVLNGSTANVTNQIGQDVITANGGSDQFNFVGFGNQAIINGPAHVDITDHSSGLTVSVNSGNQIDTIAGFGHDALGVIDLANGAGNYRSVADIMSALRSDGHGGTVLALGSVPNAGSIDFADTAISQLHASNFVIV
ncbi:hypothetical protein ACFPFP_10365 [Bradyrhizobium sp. GCM10023182]|uniref:Calcium-binding protein n=1 Tax=Bradyrhizobium zhengyangense TaxID=2911009 RepID=A0ABS9LKW8_9BRAD|nr:MULTISPECIES: hypothetical protein [Bradyrhizobium]MCG2667347.1 hypothetical protein [Bradyrhizobium zhengyangense]